MRVADPRELATAQNILFRKIEGVDHLTDKAVYGMIIFLMKVGYHRVVLDLFGTG